MGKRLITQRRGKASPVYLTPGHRHHGAVKLPRVRGEVKGTVVALEHSPGHTAPVATVRFTDGRSQRFLAAEGTFIGAEISVATAEVRPGNVMKLTDIPEATPVYNIEAQPGDGGKFVRAAGTMATVIGRSANGVTVRLPSGTFKVLHPACRATIGVVAGGGRGDKPLVKAGKAHHKYRSKSTVYPRVRGVAKNPVDHPHGGGNAHRAEGKPTTIARGTPPGRNVGHLAARRTGKRKG